METHENGCLQVCKRFVFDSIDYRLEPEVRLPEIVGDLEDAWAWLSAHAGELGVDQSRIVLLGHSAGGFLALLGGPQRCRQKGRIRRRVPAIRFSGFWGGGTTTYIVVSAACGSVPLAITTLMMNRRYEAHGRKWSSSHRGAFESRLLRANGNEARRCGSVSHPFASVNTASMARILSATSAGFVSR